MSKPIFSVIIPLEFHRGQWERCWLGWQAQTVSKTQYEIILIVPSDFPERDKLAALLGPRDRLIYSNERHDVALSAIGAARAHGQFLFFTESHCWPEPDVLEKCLQAFATHPEWVAFSCRSIRITHNRLSNAEADIYETDIEFGMKEHPWRKILDQCFVTRRDVYEECGGWKAELGHFAEWALAANYAGLGYQIGYVPEARVHHYYVGQLSELRTFTRDFATGEMMCFAKSSHEPGGHLLEVPDELICQGSWDRRLAQALLRISLYDILVPLASRLRQPLLFFRTTTHWLMRAIAGARLALPAAVAKVCWAWIMVRLAILAGSKSRISSALRTYIAALVHHQQLACLKSQNGIAMKTAVLSRTKLVSNWDVFAPQNAGFYGIEIYKGTRYRWSEPAAMMSAWMDKGRHQISVECMPFRKLVRAGLRFYVNERPISTQDVSIGPESIEITFDLAQSGKCTMGWTCLRYRAPKGDPRWFGLPIKAVRRKSDAQLALPLVTELDWHVEKSLEEVG
jgi:hypothetical protein